MLTCLLLILGCSALPAEGGASYALDPAPPDTASAAAGHAGWSDRTLAGLSLREKVAQMVMPWIPGGELNAAERRRALQLVGREGVGGVIVGKGAGAATVRNLNTLQTAAALPLLVAADLEWGPGTRLEGATLLPINMALAATGDLAYARRAGEITGIEARAAGIHMAFAPVADVNVNPNNPVINTRAYGGEAWLVSKWVSAFIAGARSAGALTVAKHFPGHGDTDQDSHLALPTIPLTRARLEEVELVPFRAAVAAGVDGIMTAHIAVPALEPDRRLPATLSAPIVTGLLRERMGFDGLIVTDALNMDGVRAGRTSGEVAVGAVLAGADILLMPASAGAAIDAVVGAVHLGLIAESRIDASVRRILDAKAAVGLPQRRTVDATAARRWLGHAEHQAWAREAAERSMTLVRVAPRLLPMVLPQRQVVVVSYDDGRGRRVGAELHRYLEANGARVRAIRLWRGSTGAELRAAERAAAAADIAIFASYARAVPWRGRISMPSPVAASADRMAAAGAILLSFGDPYLLRQAPSAQTYLVAWSGEEIAQRAAARVLTGEITVSGRLPLDLPPYHLVGEGLGWPGLAGLPETIQDPARRIPPGPVPSPRFRTPDPPAEVVGEVTNR